MPDYRRWYQAGGTYFFTVVTCRRLRLFAQPGARRLLALVLREVRDEMPFHTVAMCLLHDHLHAVWTLPDGDTAYSKRWQQIKGRFAQRWIGRGGVEAPVSTAQAGRGLRGIWQRRFWEHLVRDEDDLEALCDYIHYNPVKHGYVRDPADWPFSSFHRFQRLGQYAKGWGATEPRNVAGMDFE
jgi:putative transposase